MGQMMMMKRRRGKGRRRDVGRKETIHGCIVNNNAP